MTTWPVGELTSPCSSLALMSCRRLVLSVNSSPTLCREASQSREAAKKDVTRDEAKRIEESRKGKTTDGASDVAITESARRRQDLLPGSGHHGLIYSMAVSVTGRNEDDALRAGTRVEQAADNCGIGEIVWQDNRHDVAAFLTLPLGRGLAATKWTRIKTRG